MEPFWHFGRINQVFGRAIRFKSHVDFEDESDRTVEQYLYLSFMPEGNDIESIYKSLKDNEELWPEVQNINITENIKDTLLNSHPDVYNVINKILNVKTETKDRTIDQMMFDIMERKNKISILISNIIKESSVDCIQNTRDDFSINEKCLRFSEKLKDEDTFFPGITPETLNNIDTKQLKTSFIYKVNDKSFVISARSDNDYIYIYYKFDTPQRDDPDIRYVRENGKRICDVDLNKRKIYFYEDKKHKFNKELGAKFSVFQTTYTINENYLDDLLNELFPEVEYLIDENYIHGYVVKYNVNERLFYKFYKDKIIRLFDLKSIEASNYDKNLECFIIHKGKFYLSN